MDTDLLTRKGLNPEAPEPAKLTGYGLRIGDRATLEESAGERVFGVVIRLPEKDREQLYGEESVADYIPVKVVATGFAGTEIPAICYLLPMQQLAGQNRAYAASLAEVASKIGLPGEYVKEILNWAK